MQHLTSMSAGLAENNIVNNENTFKRKANIVELENMPFFPQEKYQCGPAAVATVLNFHNLKVSPEEVSKRVYLPEKKGSLQVELIAEIRSQKLLPYLLEPELKNILDEIESGYPVLILQNLGTDRLPVWHYAVVTGFNLKEQNLLLNSGKRQGLKINFSSFMKTWEKANYWAVVAVPVNKIPATANLSGYLSVIADMETLGKLEVAESGYKMAADYWPDSEFPLLGLANVAYQSGKYSVSRAYLLKALELAPENSDILNNLAYAFASEGCFAQALKSINQALVLHPENPEYQNSKTEIKSWQSQRQFNFCNEAKAEFD